MAFSYWEIKSWLTNIDFTIIGSGIVGLNCALKLKELFPKSNILILERGLLPQGASTKNAGFACFGSISEILDDLSSHSEQEVVNLVKKRKEGLEILRTNLTDKAIGFKKWGGYELFDKNQLELYNNCISRIDHINAILYPIFSDNVFSITENKYHFKDIKKNYIFNQFEGQLDTGKMMEALILKVQSKGIKILNNVQVENYTELSSYVEVKTNSFEFKTNKLFIATNGFAKHLLDENVKPARAQVLITKPIANLHIKGTFHLDRGFYYFRNIDDRILLGGGRQLDFKGEETTSMQETDLIQNKLEELLQNIILPEQNFEIDQRWSGIMGVGSQKKPIVKQISNHVFCGVRLGGMGVAIGSSVGIDLAGLID